MSKRFFIWSLWPGIILMILAGNLKGQAVDQTLEGTITFISSQNIYVKIPSARRIHIGDTLYYRQNDQMVPAMVVKYLSSLSCAGSPLGNLKLNVSDLLYANPASLPQTTVSQPSGTPVVQPGTAKKDTMEALTPKESKPKTAVAGYLSLAANSMFNRSGQGNVQRMQYTLFLRANHMAGSRLSLENYITFYHKNNSWGEIQKNVFNGLKIYNLALTYDFNDKFFLSAGRKLNPKISNMGAVDGLQWGMNFKPFSLGILAGSRPDYSNYGFNFKLLQYGGYLYHEIASKNGPVQSTIAFIEQTNAGKTDRRFAYLQHYNALLPKLNFYGTVEFDLYRKTRVRTDTVLVQDSVYKVDHAARLSNVYLSLRYAFSRRLNVSLSYSARQSIIYYETYKSYIDRLLEQQTRQGYFLQFNYRPGNKISVGMTGGYDFQKKDPKPSRNLYAFVNYIQVPVLNLSSTLSVSWLETVYLSGKIVRLDLYRDIIPGKLSGGIDYSFVKYNFNYAEPALPQHIGECNLTWRIISKLFFSVYYEGNFDKLTGYHHLYAQINKRF